jgi:hypothetical protein
VIVRQLARHRFLQSTHIAAIVSRSLDRINDRLSRFFHAGYLDRPPPDRFSRPTGICDNASQQITEIDWQKLRFADKEIGLCRVSGLHRKILCRFFMRDLFRLPLLMMKSRMPEMLVE